MILLALHETLLCKAVDSCYTANEPVDKINYETYSKWLTSLQSEANNKQITQFWVDILSYLNAYVGYYFSVRSGNWLLRNSCLREHLPLIFAYSHNKYEELSCTAIMDTLTFPQDIIQTLLNGGWTVSVRGRAYHNIALDEAHESIINLRLKTITSRPSHFRTVELSNFMSYLDRVVTGLESLLYRNKQTVPVDHRKRYTCQRTARMINLMKDIPLFASSTATTPHYILNIKWTLL